MKPELWKSYLLKQCRYQPHTQPTGQNGELMKSKLKVLLKEVCGNEPTDASVLNLVILPQTLSQPKTWNP